MKTLLLVLTFLVSGCATMIDGLDRAYNGDYSRRGYVPGQYIERAMDQNAKRYNDVADDIEEMRQRSSDQYRQHLYNMQLEY